MTKVKTTTSLVAGEELPERERERAVKSTNVIQEVIFMAVVSRHCLDHVSKKCLMEKLACGLLFSMSLQNIILRIDPKEQ